MAILWLFDIDGTLINVNKFHLKSYQETFQKLFQQEVPADFILKTFGLPEKKGIELMLKKISCNSPQNVLKVLRFHPQNLKKIIRGTKIVPLSGVLDFLKSLQKEQINHLGVVSGNIRMMGNLLLERAGLSSYFLITSYDNEKIKTRADILKNAITQVDSVASLEKIIVIGDTVTDIQAAKAVKAFSVGVATGTCSYRELKAEQPDLVLKSLREYKKILRTV